MAHEVETMAYAGEVPWHGLGVPVSNDLTPEEILKKAGLDWRVIKVPLRGTVTLDDGTKQLISSVKRALVRSSDGRELSTVSDDWQPVQNAEAFAFFDEFVRKGQMEMHTAGSLQGGKQVWALAKIKQGFSLFSGKDDIENFLLFSLPHQYGKTVDIRDTLVRVVCNNTFTAAMNGKSDVMIRMNHWKAFDPELVKKTLYKATKSMQEYKETAEFLASKKYTMDKVKQYFEKVFPLTGQSQADNDNPKASRASKMALDVLDTQPGAALGAGTWWQPFNAVTYLTDHQLGRNPDSRLASSWYGVGRQRKLDAMQYAVEFANAA